MANAAAKKAAAAKSSAAAVYNPILLGTNSLYLVLVIWTQHSNPWISWVDAVLILVLWALQAYAYMGILEDSAHSTSSQKQLAGGAHLDLLALTWVVQFGTVLWSKRFYWILAAIPPWAGWTMYQTVYGAVPKSAKNSYNQEPVPVDEATKEKRQKRAERRRNKWS